ncbi:MAG: ketopantoate reductase family protein [Dehalococcoidia bacterium]|nr:ketopantoate reductase family protein [Dehalococcoidia bacterium]
MAERRIGIIGAGAIGGNIGGMLTLAGQDVTLIDQWPEHVEAMKKHGLKMTWPDGVKVAKVRALHIHELQSVTDPFDYAVVAVKSYDTDWATHLIKGYVKPEGAFISAQNGINDERIAAIVGREREVGCVVTIGAGMYEPAHVQRTDRNAYGFEIGELDGSNSARAQELAKIWSGVAETHVTTNLMGHRWSKLMVNCMANAVAGLTGHGSAETRTIPELRRIGIQLGAETARVAKALGYKTDPVMGIAPAEIIDAAEGRNVEQVELKLLETAQRTAGGRPSFGQDVLKGRRTEIEYLNGYVAAQGRKAGVKTPFSDAITKLVTDLGVGFKADPDNIKPLVKMLPR